MHTNSRRWVRNAVFAAGMFAAPAAQAQVEPMPAELRVAPAPGRRAVAAAWTPSFCAGAAGAPLRRTDLRVAALRGVMNVQDASARQRSLELERASGFIAVARYACQHGADPAMRDWLQSWRQVIVNATNLDDASIDQALRGALAQSGREYRVECGEFGAAQGRPLAHERLRGELLRGLVCDRARLGSVDELAYWFDRGPAERDPMPQLVRAGLVQVALRLGSDVGGRRWDERGMESMWTSGGGGEGQSPNTQELLRWVLVRDDVAALDVAAAKVELARSGLAPEAQALALVRVARVKLLATGVGAAWRGFAARNPSVGPLLTAADQARDAWRQEVAENREGVERAWQVEEAWLSRDNARLRGCAEPLRSAFAQYAQRSGARTEDAFRALFSRPVGHLLGAAIYRCEREVGTPGHAEAFARVMLNSAVHRGARVASLQAVLRAVAQGRESDPRFVFDRTGLTIGGELDSESDWIHDVNASNARACVGVVQSLRTEGDRVHVTFRQQRVMIPTFACTRSNRISHIYRDGSVEYARDCVVNGQVESDATSDPVAIPGSAAAGVAVGVTLHALRTSADVNGYPIEVRPDARGALLAYMGIAVGGSSGASIPSSGEATPRRRGR
jgi:hypothetical protein